MKALLQGIAHLVAPRVCRVCGRSLAASEDVMCLHCLYGMPRAQVHRQPFNEIHQRLGHHCTVDRAAGWFLYRRDSEYAQLLVDAKYDALPRLAFKLGAMCAEELAADGFFTGIDALVPMPMHWTKRMRRGYNQAYEVCAGISSVTGLPIVEAIKAERSHGVQSRHGKDQRYRSITGTLAAAPQAAAQVQGRNVLFVDDIITTGSSAAEAVRALATAAPANISVLCLGLTMLD